uniref:type ISP restriction/modification enzyme n=1 Tax=Pseudomonas sp. EA_65y_Pfl1_P120 TaxID=3088693 RepID=UPI0015882FA8
MQFRTCTQPVPSRQVKVPSLRIPEAAWAHLDGKAALDWVMERQTVRTDKASGIVNEANDWAVETMGNLSTL